MSTEHIRVEVSGGHYQPDGCNQAFVVGIYWDKERSRPCLQLVYTNGKEDYIPLSELGASHPLGSIMILNTLLEAKDG